MPLHFLNAEVSPAVKLSGAIISHVLTELEITCLPAALPQFIEIDLKDLLPGASVHLADIKLPKGVTYVRTVASRTRCWPLPWSGRRCRR